MMTTQRAKHGGTEVGIAPYETVVQYQRNRAELILQLVLTPVLLVVYTSV